MLAGMVKDADMADADGDGKKDLVLALEWGGIVGFVHSGTVVTRAVRLRFKRLVELR